MIVKFFGNKKGGGTKGIDYLLDKRQEQGTSRILKGDENLTRGLIMSMQQKHKACIGCLSFEEKNINEALKYEIMESFENAFLTEAMKGRYNILWVEHTDKGRLELNFVIPKIDLESKKAFNPYFHMADCKKKDLWTDSVNLKHGFTNPKDPAKENTLQGSRKQHELIKDYEALDNMLHKQVSQGIINSRDEIISLLVSNNIQVTRQGADYISVKLPDSKKAKRLKGGIYNEQFTSIEKLGELRQEAENRAREYQQRDIKSELTRIEAELNEHIQRKNEYYKQLFRGNDKRLRKQDDISIKQDKHNQSKARADEIQAIDNNNELFNRNAYDDDFKRDCLVSVDKSISSKQGFHTNNREWQSVSKDEKIRDSRTGQFLLLSNQLKGDDDGIRIRINSRNREITSNDITLTGNKTRANRNYQLTNARFGDSRQYYQGLTIDFRERERAEQTELTTIKNRIDKIRDGINTIGNIRKRLSEKFRECRATIIRSVREVEVKQQRTRTQRTRTRDNGFSMSR